MDLLLHLLSLVLSVFTFGGLVEHYKRHRDRKAVANIIAADVNLQRELAQFARRVLPPLTDQLKAGRDVPLPPGMYTFDPTYMPIMERSVEQVGLLPNIDAEYIVKFYGLMMGARLSVRNWVGADFSKTPNAAAAKLNLITLGQGYWDTADLIGDVLVPRLEKEARRIWLQALCKDVCFWRRPVDERPAYPVDIAIRSNAAPAHPS